MTRCTVKLSPHKKISDNRKFVRQSGSFSTKAKLWLSVRKTRIACHRMTTISPIREWNIFPSATLTSCKMHIVSRKCLRLQIPMSFGQSDVLACEATVSLVTQYERSRCALAASLWHVPMRRHVTSTLVPSLSHDRLVQVTCTRLTIRFCSQATWLRSTRPDHSTGRWYRYAFPTSLLSARVIGSGQQSRSF